MIAAECSWPTRGSGVRGHVDGAVVVENVDVRAVLRVQCHGAHSARPGLVVEFLPVCCVIQAQVTLAATLNRPGKSGGSIS